MKRDKLIEYENGAYLFGNYFSIVCQNWILLNIDEKTKREHNDEIYYLVYMPYTNQF